MEQALTQAIIVAVIVLIATLFVFYGSTKKSNKPLLYFYDPLKDSSLKASLARIDGNELIAKKLLGEFASSEAQIAKILGYSPKKSPFGEVVKSVHFGRIGSELTLMHGYNNLRVRLGFIDEIINKSDISASSATEMLSVAKKAAKHGYLVFAISQQNYQKKPVELDEFVAAIYCEVRQLPRLNTPIATTRICSGASPEWLSFYTEQTLGKQRKQIIFRADTDTVGADWDAAVESATVYANVDKHSAHRIQKHLELTHRVNPS